MTKKAEVSNSPIDIGDPKNAMFDSGNFFEDLDSSINGGILDEPTKSEPDAGKSASNDVQSTKNGDDNSDIENLRQRYQSSSTEAKRLNNRLTEIEPYLPILDAMREDPNLITHVRGYFQGGGQAPVSMKEQLNLDEDFVFDADAAMSDTSSDSSKLLQATIDGVVQKRLNDALMVQQRESAKKSNEAAFRSQHDMSDEEWQNFIQFAKNKSLELEDIWYLKNREARDKTITQDVNDQVSNQMKKAQSKPPSLATASSQDEPNVSVDDQIFDAISSFDTQLEQAFG